MCCVALVCVDIIAGLAPSTSTAWKCCTFEHDQFKVVPCSCLSWFISWSTRTYGRYIWSQPVFLANLQSWGAPPDFFWWIIVLCDSSVPRWPGWPILRHIYIETLLLFNPNCSARRYKRWDFRDMSETWEEFQRSGNDGVCPQDGGCRANVRVNHFKNRTWTLQEGPPVQHTVSYKWKWAFLLKGQADLDCGSDV